MKVKKIADAPQLIWMLVLDGDDEVVNVLTSFATHNGLTAAFVNGVGAMASATLGYYDMDQQRYLEIPVDEQVEVVSLVGTIAPLDDGGPQLHAHAVLGRRDGSTLGGHLLAGHIRPRAEFILTEAPGDLRRRTDPEGRRQIDGTTPVSDTGHGYLRPGVSPGCQRPRQRLRTPRQPRLLRSQHPRRLDEWSKAGLGQQLPRIGLLAYDQMIGLDLAGLSVDGSITKSPVVVGVRAQTRLTGANRAPDAPWPVPVTGSRCIWSRPARTITTRRCWSRLWPGSPDMIGPLPDRAVHAPRPRLRLGQDPGPPRDPGLSR